MGWKNAMRKRIGTDKERAEERKKKCRGSREEKKKQVRMKVEKK